jgi:AraC-like DNA-binding protein
VEPGVLGRHRHAAAYAAVVLEGAYEEAGDSGRLQVEPGDVVVHGRWEAHLNRTPAKGARVLNLPVGGAALAPFGQIADPDALVRLAERDLAEAVRQLQVGFLPRPPKLSDWPDLLASALAAGDEGELGQWARRLGISREHLSRGFRRVYGVTPQRYRLEARNRAALSQIIATGTPLAHVALDHGFSDQAHLTRSVQAFTGRPPSAWRRSNRFKTRT